MEPKKERLLKSAAKLYSLGIDLEAAKERIRKLVDAGVNYESEEMMQAVREYKELKQQWDRLEQAYLQLRDEIYRSGC